MSHVDPISSILPITQKKAPHLLTAPLVSLLQPSNSCDTFACSRFSICKIAIYHPCGLSARDTRANRVYPSRSAVGLPVGSTLCPICRRAQMPFAPRLGYGGPNPGLLGAWEWNAANSQPTTADNLPNSICVRPPGYRWYTEIVRSCLV